MFCQEFSALFFVLGPILHGRLFDPFRWLVEFPTIHVRRGDDAPRAPYFCVAVSRASSKTEAAGIYVSVFGASCSFFLWAYKMHYGRVLRSMVLIAVSRRRMSYLTSLVRVEEMPVC